MTNSKPQLTYDLRKSELKKCVNREETANNTVDRYTIMLQTIVRCTEIFLTEKYRSN